MEAVAIMMVFGILACAVKAVQVIFFKAYHFTVEAVNDYMFRRNRRLKYKRRYGN